MWLVGVVSVWQAEAQLVCSCGVRGLGVNDRFEQGVCFSRGLLRNECLAFFFYVSNKSDFEIKMIVDHQWKDINIKRNDNMGESPVPKAPLYRK